MVNKILDSISIGLHKLFGDDYHYYIEDVQQNLQRPAFTIDVLIPIERSYSPTSYFRTMPIVIHYFSSNPMDNKKECYAIAEQIFESVEYITLDGRLLRGKDISWSIVDNVLQFFITYEFYTEVVGDPTYMEDLNDLNLDIKY